MTTTKINISEIHKDVREDERQELIERLEGLGKFFSHLISVDIHLSQQNQHYSLRLIAHLPRKKILKAEYQSRDLSLAINHAINALKRQLKDFKEQLGEHYQEKTLSQQIAQELD